jgi:hypothetical protein
MSETSSAHAPSGAETIAAAREAADAAFEAAEKAVTTAHEAPTSAVPVLAAWVNETLRNSPLARDVDAWTFVTGPALKDLERRLLPAAE